MLPLLPPYFIAWQRYVRQIGDRAQKMAARRELEGPAMKKLRRRNARAQAGSNSIPVAAMRKLIRSAADRQRRSAAVGWTITTAAHGLCFTQPFHDKRVVELGLAIPEELYVKNGINRYLARRALADVYPPEFQSRSRSNEGVLDEVALPDWAIPELLSDADRLGKSAKLSAYFDFARARDFLTSAECAEKRGRH